MRIRSPRTVQQMQPLFIEDFFIRVDDECLVDANLSEFILDHGNSLAMVLGEAAIEERGLSGPRKPVSTVTGIFFMGRLSGAISKRRRH